jgi:hypothetical protein
LILLWVQVFGKLMLCFWVFCYELSKDCKAFRMSAATCPVTLSYIPRVLLKKRSDVAVCVAKCASGD